MRLLLILSMMLASLAMTAPVDAQAGNAGMACHAMQSPDAGHAPGHDGADERLQFHVCPGCACIGSEAASAQAPRAVADYRPTRARSLASYAVNPIPPPPRTA